MISQILIEIASESVHSTWLHAVEVCACASCVDKVLTLCWYQETQFAENLLNCRSTLLFRVADHGVKASDPKAGQANACLRCTAFWCSCYTQSLSIGIGDCVVWTEVASSEYFLCDGGIFRESSFLPMPLFIYHVHDMFTALPCYHVSMYHLHY